MTRHSADTLRRFARDLFCAAGIEAEKAEAMAKYLVLADMMGHSTHGLALTPMYMTSIEAGQMTGSGAVDVIRDKGAAVTWNARRLPGAWTTAQAVALAVARAEELGTCTVTLADSHHIGALAVYLPEATSRGLMISVASSSPSGRQVAPFGGLKGVYTPDPIAYGIPTPGDPILIDISASITTFNMAQRLIREGRSYPHDWLMEADGMPTADPQALNRGGTLMPAGGLDHGQKGYGLALWAEALTQGLAGWGRVDDPKGTCSAITVQVWDPEAFGGRDAFLRQTGWLAEACRSNPPRPGVEKVRLPGESAARNVARAEAEGVALHAGILDAMAPYADKLGVAMPDRAA